MESLPFDVRVFPMLGALSSASLLLAVVVAVRLDKSAPGIRDLAVGALTMAVGLLLLASPGTLPIWVAAVPGNMLVIFGLGSSYLGSRELLGAARGRPWQWIAVGCISPLLLYLTFVAPSPALRILIVSIVIAGFLISCTQAFWRCRETASPTLQRWTALAFGFGSALFVISFVGLVIVDSLGGIAASPEWLVAIPYLYAIPFNGWIGLFLIVIVSDRVTDRLAQALESAEISANQLEQANEQLAILSVTDKLTGIYNRVKLDEVLGEELRRAQRYPTDLSIVIMDIDHFKQVNDQHGHMVGDAVLVRLAEVLRNSGRATDTIGRWGGEEFLVILPATACANAVEVAEKIRSTVADSAFPSVRQLTVSLGVASYQTGETREKFLARADAALYEAKDGGRNRVVQAAISSAGIVPGPIGSARDYESGANA